jgi:hypothetical protein
LAKCPAPGRSPGQSAWRQGTALAHGARPGETARNEDLSRRIVSKWVIARAKYLRIGDCADGAPPNGQIALRQGVRQGVRQGKVPGARGSALRMALAPAKRPEMMPVRARKPDGRPQVTVSNTPSETSGRIPQNCCGLIAPPCGEYMDFRITCPLRCEPELPVRDDTNNGQYQEPKSTLVPCRKTAGAPRTY